jgi:hypothetical protein
MPIQSSFLIRCWLDSLDSSAAVKRFHIEHVQSGKTLHSSNWEEIKAWLHQVNLQFVAGASTPQGDETGGC